MGYECAGTTSTLLNKAGVNRKCQFVEMSRLLRHESHELFTALASHWHWMHDNVDHDVWSGLLLYGAMFGDI